MHVWSALQRRWIGPRTVSVDAGPIAWSVDLGNATATVTTPRFHRLRQALHNLVHG